jgi:signal transduction histidine kinase
LKKRKSSLIVRIVCYLIGFEILLLLVLWIVQTVLLPVLYKNNRVKMTAAAVEEIGMNITEHLFYRTTIQIAREQSACVRVLRKSGTELFTVEYMPYCEIHSYSKDELMELWNKAEKEGGTLTMIYPMNSPQLQKLVPSGVYAIIYMKIFDLPGNETTAVFFNCTITPIDGMIDVLRQQLIWVTSITLIVTAALGIFVSQKTVRPIIKLNEQAKKLSSRDYSVEFSSGGYREIEELCDTLNASRREMEILEGLRRELIANVSHDLRTPLSMIIAYSEVMRDIPEENTPENVQVIIDEATRLANLIDDVLNSPFPGSSTGELKCTVYDLAVSIKSTIRRYNKLSTFEQYEINYDGPEHTPVYADRTKISQVIYNLLNNAIFHSRNKQDITVRLIPLGEQIRVEVEDKGVGIPEEKLASIWNRYYTDSQDKNFHAGLGFTIVRQILEQHGAQYGVISKVGEGFTFWFCLETKPENNRLYNKL